MTDLVTGGAGLIGSHIVDVLLERGRDVRILDNLDEQTHPNGPPTWIPADAEFVRGDVRDTDTLAESLDGVEDVYHQAAFGGFTTEISKYYDVNVTGTARIFEVIAERRLPVRKVLIASSQANYGEGVYRCSVDGAVQPPLRSVEQLERGEWEVRCPQCGRPTVPTLTHEEALWNGETPYAVSKLAAERTAIGMGRKLRLPTVALRYALTFGPRQSVYNPYTGIVSIFSTLLLNGIRPHIYEDGEQTRDFIFVGDVAQANLHLMNDDRADWRVFNVGRSDPVRVIDLVNKLAGALGVAPDYQLSGEFRPGDVRHLVHETGRIRSLGWNPERSVEDGLSAVVEWFGTLGDLKEYFSNALPHLRDQGVVMAARPT
jgi:dTDP-L-rhamnose 4-epimerase